MFYLIFYFGVALILFSQYRKNRIENLVKKQTKKKSSLPKIRINKLRNSLKEWYDFFFSHHPILGKKNFILTLIIALAFSVIQVYYLKFNSWFVVIETIFLLFLIPLNLGRKIKRNTFRKEFLGALSTMNAATSTGNSIHQAIHRCSEETDKDIGKVFNLIDRRLNLGEEYERVFKDTIKFYPYTEFAFFSIIMILTLKSGSQIKTLINRLSSIISISIRQEQRRKALTAEARMSIKILAALPIIFFLIIKYIQPENADFILYHSTGRLILYYVIASELLGIFIISFLIKRASMP